MNHRPPKTLLGGPAARLPAKFFDCEPFRFTAFEGKTFREKVKKLLDLHGD